MITLIIIIAAIISVVLIKTAISSITQLSSTDLAINNSAVEYLTEGCAEEALIHFKRDDSYSGETLTFSGGSCIITASTQGEYTIFSITGSLNNFYRTLTVNASTGSWDN